MRWRGKVMGEVYVKISRSGLSPCYNAAGCAGEINNVENKMQVV